MSDISSQKLDKLDMKILKELSLNCRQTNSQIARRVHASKNTVFYRIKQLEKNKIVTKYQCVMDFSKITGTYCRIGIKLRSKNIDTMKLKTISNNTNIHWLALSRGRYDIVMVLFYDRFNELKEFTDKLYEKLDIENLRISMLSRLYECNNNYLFNEIIKNPNISDFKYSENNIDELDIKILEHLTKDSRTSILDIAKNIKSTAKTILQRKRALEKHKIITGYKAIINHEFFDLKYYRIYIFCNNSEEKKKIREHLLFDPFTAYIVEPLGGVSDFELEIYAKDMKEAYGLCDKLRNRFNSIKDYEFLFIENKIKEF